MDNKMEEFVKNFDKNQILLNEPMRKHTSFKIGGNADYFVKIESEEELRTCLHFAEENKIPFCVIGNGTNLLVREGGIRGIVLKMEQCGHTLKKQENFAHLTAKAGMTLANLAWIAMKNNLTGLEEMSGIPGTLGGAIKMNAGAYGKEMKDIVVSSKCMDIKGNIRELNLQEHHFEYRKSAFEKNGLILLETTIKLSYGEQSEIQQKMEEYKERRSKKQPLEFPNAGSAFKRNGKVPTAKLIEDAGLKGYSIGGAEVSTKHAVFIINKGNATSEDVLALIEQVKQTIKEKFQQDIELEIIVIGEE